MTVNRMDKIDELVKHEVAIELQSVFPEKIISVTQVEVSRDLSFAKVWIGSIDETENVVKECQHIAMEIQMVLAKKLIMRRVPKLRFYADNSSFEAAKIEKLIEETKDGTYAE